MTVRPDRETRLELESAPAPGEIRLVQLGGRSVGLFNVDGTLHALADRCPHRGAPLCSRGAVVNAVTAGPEGVTLSDHLALVRCPWHKWDFEIATGRCPVDDRMRVRRYRVEIDEDEIVVTLDLPSDGAVDSELPSMGDGQTTPRTGQLALD